MCFLDLPRLSGSTMDSVTTLNSPAASVSDSEHRQLHDLFRGLRRLLSRSIHSIGEESPYQLTNGLVDFCRNFGLRPEPRRQTRWKTQTFSEVSFASMWCAFC